MLGAHFHLIAAQNVTGAPESLARVYITHILHRNPRDLAEAAAGIDQLTAIPDDAFGLGA